MADRPAHFMPAALLQSQFDALEPLGMGEAGATADISHGVENIVDDFLAGLAARHLTDS